MKNYIIICFAFLFLVFHNTYSQKISKKQKNDIVSHNVKNKYTIKSGEILLFSEMQGMRTKITVLFDDYGNKEVTESIGYRIADEGLKLKVHTKSIIVEGALISIDMEEGTAKKMSLDSYIDAGGINFNALSDSISQSIGLKKTQDKDTVLGYVCDVWSLQHPTLPLLGKYSVWNNILLKSEALTAGIPMETYAVKFEENKIIDNSVFTIPPDISIIESDNTKNKTEEKVPKSKK